MTRHWEDQDRCRCCVAEEGTDGVAEAVQPRRADSAVYLSNDYSALCAYAGNKITNGSKVIQWGCTDAQDERWVFDEITDSNGKRAYTLQNAYSGKCLGLGSAATKGSQLIQWTCNGAADEKWSKTAR